MDEQLLYKIGLSKGEVSVYLALIGLGEATVGPIVSISKVTKSKVYDILDKLIDKGLVGYIVKEGVKHYTANNPRMINEYVNKKLEEIQDTKDKLGNVVHELLLQRNLSNQRRIAEIYEGFKGLKSIREELRDSMKPGETMLVLGAPKIANEKWESWLLEFHKERVKRKINLKMIYNSDVREYGKLREKMKLTEIKYLPNKLVSPNWIDIFPEEILIVTVLKEPITFILRDKEVAKSFRAYFDIMWGDSIKD